MKLFPNKEFSITTHLSVDEVKEKLLQLFNKEKGRDYNNLFQTSKFEKRYYYGFIKENKFSLFHDDPYVLRKATDAGTAKRNSEYVCEGTIEDNNEYTQVLITIDTKKRSSLNRLSSLVINIAVILFLSYLNKNAWQIPYMPYLLSLLFIISFCAEFYFRKKYFNKVKLFLITLFEA